MNKETHHHQTKSNCNLNRIGMLIACVFFVNCEPGVHYKKSIFNTSNHDLRVVVHPKEKIYHKQDTIVINRNTEVIINDFNGIGSTSQFSDCNYFLDSLSAKIIDKDSLKLMIDLNTAFEFRVTQKGYKSGGYCNCKLTITNDMIK